MKVHERRRRLAADIGLFAYQYAQKRGPKGHEPNDRHYSHKIEQVVKRMDPDELDLLLRNEDDLKRKES